MRAHAYLGGVLLSMQGIQMAKLPEHCSGKLSQLLNALALAAPESPGPPCLCRTQPWARGRPATLGGGVPSWRLHVVVLPRAPHHWRTTTDMESSFRSHRVPPRARW